MENELKQSNCITAAAVRELYGELVRAEPPCGPAGEPCLRDGCKHCAVLLYEIEATGDACEARGCSLRRCIYDVDRVRI